MKTTFKAVNTNLINVQVNAVNNKASFMKFVETFGVKKNTRLHSKLNFLIQDASNIIEWFQHFDGNMDHISETTDAYKASRLQHYKMDLQSFLFACSIDLKAACETLFQDECPQWTIDKLNTRLYDGDLTLDEVYSVNQSDNWYNSLSKIVRANIRMAI